jgi:hypothetical protein
MEHNARIIEQLDETLQRFHERNVRGREIEAEIKRRYRQRSEKAK